MFFCIVHSNFACLEVPILNTKSFIWKPKNGACFSRTSPLNWPKSLFYQLKGLRASTSLSPKVSIAYRHLSSWFSCKCMEKAIIQCFFQISECIHVDLSYEFKIVRYDRIFSPKGPLVRSRDSYYFPWFQLRTLVHGYLPYFRMILYFKTVTRNSSLKCVTPVENVEYRNNFY